MSAPVRCPTPVACGAESHRAGTAAATACRSRITRKARSLVSVTEPGGVDPALYAAAHSGLLEGVLGDHAGLPLAPGVPADKTMVDVQRVLTARDAQDWSRGCGRAHPTGGYHQRLVVVSGALVTVRYRDAGGVVHREDGPADISLDRRGKLVAASWFRHGARHNDLGPAVLSAVGEVPPRFYLDDVELGAPTTLDGLGGATRSVAGSAAPSTPSARCALSVALAAHRAAGSSAREAMCWLVVGDAVGDHAFAGALREDGADAGASAAAAAAGVDDPDVITEVGHGRLPLSWATSGIESSNAVALS